VVSTVVSLTITPMICAHYIKAATSHNANGSTPSRGFTVAHRGVLPRTLRVVLGFPFDLIVFFATIALTVVLYIRPEGLFPDDDPGFVIGSTGRLPISRFNRCSGCSSNWPTSS
jgi:multidrug efflux pump